MYLSGFTANAVAILMLREEAQGSQETLHFLSRSLPHVHKRATFNLLVPANTMSLGWWKCQSSRISFQPYFNTRAEAAASERWEVAGSIITCWWDFTWLLTGYAASLQLSIWALPCLQVCWSRLQEMFLHALWTPDKQRTACYESRFRKNESRVTSVNEVRLERAPLQLILASLLLSTFINDMDGYITAFQTKPILTKRVSGSDKDR